MIEKDLSFDVVKPTLYIVSTPIGNLRDITYRAIEILNEVDYILAEDTRVTVKLTQAYNIKTPLRSYQGYNEEQKSKEAIEWLKSGLSLALVSDAGTPLLSDPGHYLIKEAIANGFSVVPIPGASAILASIVASGLNAIPFTFLGFLPRKVSDIKKVLQNYENRKESLVIFESPLRVKKTLIYLYEYLGNRQVCLSKELTKKFETFTRGNLEDFLNEEIDQRGEYVIVVGPSNEEIQLPSSYREQVANYMSKGYSKSEAIKLSAKDFKVHKSVVYKDILDNDI